MTKMMEKKASKGVILVLLVSYTSNFPSLVLRFWAKKNFCSPILQMFNRSAVKFCSYFPLIYLCNCLCLLRSTCSVFVYSCFSCSLSSGCFELIVFQDVQSSDIRIAVLNSRRSIKRISFE